MEIQSAFEKIGKGTFWVFLGLASSKIFFLLAQILIGRFMGPEKYGLISLGITILTVITIIASLGLETGVRRYLPQYESEKERFEIIGFSTLAVLLSSVIFGILLFVFSEFLSSSFFNNPSLASILKIFAFGIPAYALGLLFLRSLEGMLIMKYRFWIEGLLSGFVLIGGVALGLGTDSILVVSGAYVATYGVMMTASGLVLGREVAFWKNSLESLISRARELLSYSWPLAFYSSLAIAVRYANIIIIGLLMSEFEVGLYSAAANIAVITSVMLAITTPMFFPLVSKMNASGSNSEEVFKILTKGMILLTLPFIIGGMVFSEDILRILFGKDFVQAGLAFGIILGGYAFEVLSGPIEMYLNSFDHTEMVMANMIVSTVVVLGGAFLMIPKMGIVGAAFAYLLAIFVQKGLAVFELYLTERIHPFKSGVMKIILLAILTGVIWYGLEKFIVSLFVLALIVSVSIIVYIYLVWKNFLDSEDLEAFEGIKTVVLDKMG